MARRGAKPGEWAKARPMGSPAATVQVGAVFTDAEAAVLREGLVPEEQEDKWYAVFDEATSTVRAYRSWTGVLVFEARLEREGSGWKVATATINRDPEQVKTSGDDRDGALVRSTLRLIIDYI